MIKIIVKNTERQYPFTLRHAYSLT